MGASLPASFWPGCSSCEQSRAERRVHAILCTGAVNELAVVPLTEGVFHVLFNMFYSAPLCLKWLVASSIARETKQLLRLFAIHRAPQCEDRACTSDGGGVTSRPNRLRSCTQVTIVSMRALRFPHCLPRKLALLSRSRLTLGTSTSVSVPYTLHPTECRRPLYRCVCVCLRTVLSLEIVLAARNASYSLT